MEARMQKDTLKRVTDALKASREGKLVWLQGNATPIPVMSPDNNPAAVHSSSGLMEKMPATTTNTTTTATTEPVKGENALLSALENANNSNAAATANNEVKPEALRENIKNHFLATDRSLEFLTNGFEELIKCRKVLASFPQFPSVLSHLTIFVAIFSFWNGPILVHILSSKMLTTMITTPMAGKVLLLFVCYVPFNMTYIAFLRRNNWLRARYNDHRTTFEFLQADLESTVETLSDILARRRLRASQTQITQATQAAKQKRVEFETFLMSYAAAKASTITTPNTQAMNRLDAFTTRSRTRRAHNRERSNRLHQRLQEFPDVRDLNNLLLELDLVGLGEAAGEGGPRIRSANTSRPTANPYYGAPTGSSSNSRSRRSHRPRRRNPQRIPAPASVSEG